MKYLFIILTIISINLFIPSIDKEFRVEAPHCPQPDDKSILYVNGILLETFHNTDKKKLMDMEEHRVIQQDIESLLSLGSEAPQALREYWEKKGVETVSDPDVCKKISIALNSERNRKPYINEFRKVYYQIERDRYLIIYIPEESRFSERHFPNPQIMDKDFNIIENLNK